MGKWITSLLLGLLLSYYSWGDDQSGVDKQHATEKIVEREMIENLDLLSNLEMLDSDALWQTIPEEGVSK